MLFRLRNYGRYEIEQDLALKGVEPRINQVLLPLLTIAGNSEVRQEIESFARQHAKKQLDSRGEP